MSNGEVRKVSLQDIQLVQNLIERCLQLYMSESEVVSTLLHQAKIEPGFTELVWQKLEAENLDFFRAYNLRLIVKDQIIRFNELLEKQAELMRQVGITSVSLSNGSLHLMHNNSVYQVPQPAGPPIKPENMHHTVNTLTNGYTNGASALQPSMQVPANMPENMHQAVNTVTNGYTNGASRLQPSMQVPANMPAHAGRIDVPENMLLAQNPNSGIVQGMNRVMIKAESGLAADSHFMFSAENNLMEPRNAIGEASISPFPGGESSTQALNESILDPEMGSFGFLGQIPRNFSLSDLTADFSNSTDILETYSRSPYLPAEANFIDSHIRGEQQDAKRLDTISEGLSYDDFASD